MGIKQLKGMAVLFHDEAGVGIISEEDEDSIFIKHPFFTGWMLKTDFWDMWGTESD